MGLKLGYLALTLLVIIALYVIGFRAIDDTFGKTKKAQRKKTLFILGLLLWNLYIFALDGTELLQTFEFPPRFVLLLILPAFLFTGFFIYRNRKSEWLQNIPKSWLIFIQAFRIGVETLFVFSLTAGVLHSNVTIEGYNFDMILGITAPVVGFLFLRKIVSVKALILWNYLGLLILASVILVFMTTIFTPGIYGFQSTPMPLEFTRYPYTTVAGFLMPVAVFIHVLSIVQLTHGKMNPAE